MTLEREELYMEIEIRKLTPELADDYVRFFDKTPHDNEVDEEKCYCVGWCGSGPQDFSCKEKRRSYAREIVENGLQQGYLAYCENEAVGWCNTNTKSACLQSPAWTYFMSDVPTDGKEAEVKSIFCFVIAPHMKRRGIATKLLERICADAAEGLSFVEVYPNKQVEKDYLEFMGPARMYEKNGFTVTAEIKDRYVMRKSLI